MNNNILLSSPRAFFESHASYTKELPFIYHKDVIIGKGLNNFHENVEVLFFIEGKGCLKCDQNVTEVKAGEIAVINSYSIHQTESTDKLIYHCLIVDKAFFKDHNIDVERLQFQQYITDEAMNNLYTAVVNEYEKDNDFRSAGIKSAVLALLLYLCRNYSVPKNQRDIHSANVMYYVFPSINYMKENLHRKLNIDEIANHIGISKYHFIRLFKKETGYTVINYLNILRCEHAKELLLSDNVSIKQVANLCGFDNYSYFIDVFKRYIGLTPSEFKKKVSNLSMIQQ